ncbi:MAG: FCD domain-containing protein [Hyphomonadaceae bacterium]|nr:FCD domain-containing protein [Hyphomonadaceae bacterium]
MTSSAVTAASRAVSTYLELSNVSLAEQYEALRVIETQAAKFAAETTSELQVTELRARASEVAKASDNVELNRFAMQLRIAIADASGRPPLGLFQRALARVLTAYVRPDLRVEARDREFELRIAADLSQIVEAIVAGDASLAEYIVRSDVLRREQRANQIAASHPILTKGPLSRESPTKLAEQVAFAIRDDVAARGWPIGAKLGDEAELPGKYGVSPWVLRQGVRILEPHGIVHMRRGQGGGLFVGQPSPDYTVACAVGYLQSTGISVPDALSIRQRLFQSIAQLAALRSSQDERERLLGIALENNGHEQHRRFCAALGDVCKNQVLALFGAILNAFGGSDDHDAASRRMVAEAISAGDGALARRRMNVYLTS